MRPPPDEEVPEVPKGPRIIFHLIRHGQAKHDDMHNNLTEKERLSLEDPKLTKLGIKQAETLGKNFPRLPFITSIFSSPSRRCIQTALHVLDPILGPEVPINVSPFFRELSKFKCDQPLPRSRLQEKFKKENCIEWALLESQQDLWQCDARGYARVTLKEQAELCRKLLYETGQMYIKEGRLNAEGNVEIVVIGHVLLLNAIMGNTAYSSRKFRPWEHTELRSLAFLPKRMFPGLKLKEEDIFEEIEASVKLSIKGVVITSPQAADTLGVNHGRGQEGGNVHLTFDQRFLC